MLHHTQQLLHFRSILLPTQQTETQMYIFLEHLYQAATESFPESVLKGQNMSQEEETKRSLTADSLPIFT